MRVAVLTREFPPDTYGGAGVHVAELTAALDRLVSVEVRCFGEPRSSELVAGAYKPWPVLASARPESGAFGALSVDLAMASALGSGAAGPPAICHSHTWYANMAGHLSKLTWDIPHVVTTHSLEPLRPWKVEQLGGGYALSSWCERTALEAADAVIAVSDAMRADVLACYPAVEPTRVEVIHNGIDTDRWSPDPDTDVLERYGLDPSEPLVVFVGRVTRQKGLSHLLAAAPLMDRRAQLVCCAGAADTVELAAEVDQLASAAREAGVRLTWIESQLPQREVAQLLTHAGVFVCPSVYEPFGLVNLEAMACGTAVVASAVGGIPEVVDDGTTGLLVPLEMNDAAAAPSFAAGLAGAINALVGDPARAERMGEAGRARAVERFSWSAVAERTAALYRRLASV
ncbi:MAG: glycogen synthase [Acidimicrobiales bacterium]